MTLPNRADYAPGELRRARGVRRREEVTTASDSSSGSDSDSDSGAEETTDAVNMLECGAESLWTDACAMLEAVAPARAKHARQQQHPSTGTGPVSGPEAVARRKQVALAAWRRLENDEGFEDAWNRVGVRSLLADADGSEGRDAFAEAVELMPSLPADVPTAVARGLDPACLDGVLVTGDDSIRAKFERAARQLLEWGRRRLAFNSPETELVPEPPRSTSPTEMLKEGIVSVDLIKEEPPASPSPAPAMTPTPTPTLAAYGFDLSGSAGKAKRRATLNDRAKEMLREWFEAHVHHPYPAEEEKEKLARAGGITLEQVNNWFINTRGRKWKPMLKRLMAEKQKGECKLLDEMVQRMTEPYQREL